MIGFEKTRVAEEVVRHLLRSIFDRTLRPGDRLPSERSLASRLGVNRASLREALKRLELMGLVKTRQGDGTRVLDFMSSAGLELLQLLIPHAAQDSPGLVRDLFEVRMVLGREMARLAAGRCTPEDLTALRRVQAEAVAQARHPAELLVLDTELFATLGRATHNRVVQLLANSIHVSVRHHPEVFERPMPEAAVTLDYHRDLIDALAAGDATTAAALTERYLEAMMDRLE
jgi:GntR family transcriptional repressor for pyruvate dehydrogenase complex